MGSHGHTIDLPEFARGSRLLEQAHQFALSAHHGPARKGDTTIEHPETVARLLHESGFDDDVVAAALLHDVVEDTSTDVDAIERDFGSEIAHLVEVMTEDEQIEPYEARKAEHRARIAEDGRAAAIYAADKFANTKRMKEAGDMPGEQKLEHYTRTLETLRRAQPDLPFLDGLQVELDALRAVR